MEIIKKKTITAPKLLVYGGPGVGKSTLASQLPSPLFVDVEGGLNYLDVARTPLIKDPDDFYRVLIEMSKTPVGEYKTIVIDSIDWLVRKLTEKIAKVGYDGEGNRVTGTIQIQKTLSNNLMDANGGYGKAKEELENHIRSLLIPLLNTLNQAGYGICVIAHAYVTGVLDDDGTNIEKVLPKIDPPTIGKKPIASPAFIEWADNVFYLKKVNGERIVQVESDNYATAKNRLGLEGEYNLKDTTINQILGLEKEK